MKTDKKTSDRLDFDKTLNKSIKLLKTNKNFVIPFLTIVGINTGLRISDLLKITHFMLSGESFTITEKKTGKTRKITINENIKNSYEIFKNRLGNFNENDSLFLSQKGCVYTTRSINRELKKLYQEKNLNISTHTLRKTYGYRVFENNNESERSLILLSDIFNHSNSSITRVYLGIREKEISDIYLNL